MPSHVKVGRQDFLLMFLNGLSKIFVQVFKFSLRPWILKEKKSTAAKNSAVALQQHSSIVVLFEWPMFSKRTLELTRKKLLL